MELLRRTTRCRDLTCLDDAIGMLIAYMTGPCSPSSECLRRRGGTPPSLWADVAERDRKGGSGVGQLFEPEACLKKDRGLIANMGPAITAHSNNPVAILRSCAC